MAAGAGACGRDGDARTVDKRRGGTSRVGEHGNASVDVVTLQLGGSRRRCGGRGRGDGGEDGLSLLLLLVLMLLLLLLLLLLSLLLLMGSSRWGWRRTLRRRRYMLMLLLLLRLMRLLLRLLLLLLLNERRLARQRELEGLILIDELVKHIPRQTRVDQNLQVLARLGEDILGLSRLLLLLLLMMLAARVHGASMDGKRVKGEYKKRMDDRKSERVERRQRRRRRQRRDR